MLRHVSQSATILEKYNLCVISRMKLRKNELENSIRPSTNPMEHVINQFYPFSTVIGSKEIKTYVSPLELKKGHAYLANWEVYCLVIFNLLQNSVKYNNPKGCIVII